MKKKILAAGAVFTAILIIIFGLTIRRELGSPNLVRNYAAEIEKYQSQFFADQQLLGSIDFFKISPRTHDAGPFLNPIVGWSPQYGSSKELQAYTEKTKKARLVLPQEISYLLDPGRRELMLQLTDPKVQKAAAKIDFSWIDALDPFDYWDYTTGEPLSSLTPQLQELPLTLLPIPEFKNLVAWYKLRLAKAILDRNLVPAFKAGRKIASLVYNSNTVIGPLIATQMLGMERQVYEQGLKNHTITRKAWQPFSIEITQAARRAIYSYLQLLNVWAPPAFLDKAFDGKSAVAGMCSGINEGASAQSFLRPIFSTTYPFEVDYRDRVQHIDSLIQKWKEPCKIDKITFHAWENAKPPQLRPLQDELGWRAPALYLGFRLPVLRRYVVYSLVASSPLARMYGKH